MSPRSLSTSLSLSWVENVPMFSVTSHSDKASADQCLHEFTKFLQASWSSPPTCCSMCAESDTLYTYATPGVKVRAVSFWSHPNHFSRYSFSFLRLPAFLSSASIEETLRSPSYIVHVWISCQWEELVRMQCFCACRTPISGVKM